MSNPAKIKRFLDRDIWIIQVFASKLESTAKVLAARIAFHLYIESGQLQVNIESLGSEIGLSGRQVKRLIVILEQSGWISVKRSRGLSNSFQLTLPPGVEQWTEFPKRRVPTQDIAMSRVDDLCDNPTQDIAMSPHPGHSYVTPPRTSDVPHNSERSVAKRSGERASPSAGAPASPPHLGSAKEGSADAALARLRAAWRLKPSGKDPEAAIRAAWFAAIKIASPDTIADAGEAWIAANKAHSQPRYIEKLSDWLERRAWELEPPWQKPKSRANGKSKSHTNGHGGKGRRSDDSKNELRAAGLDIADREDAKRRAQS